MLANAHKLPCQSLPGLSQALCLFALGVCSFLGGDGGQGRSAQCCAVAAESSSLAAPACTLLGPGPMSGAAGAIVSGMVIPKVQTDWRDEKHLSSTTGCTQLVLRGSWVWLQQNRVGEEVHALGPGYPPASLVASFFCEYISSVFFNGFF